MALERQVDRRRQPAAAPAVAVAVVVAGAATETERKISHVLRAAGATVA